MRGLPRGDALPDAKHASRVGSSQTRLVAVVGELRRAHQMRARRELSGVVCRTRFFRGRALRRQLEGVPLQRMRGSILPRGRREVQAMPGLEVPHHRRGRRSLLRWTRIRVSPNADRVHAL